MTTRYSDAQLHDMAARRGVEGLGPRPKERKKRDNEESRSQKAVIKWWQMACRGFGVPEILLFKITNEGGRGPVVGSILKAEGLRTGAPDLMLAVPQWTDDGLPGSSEYIKYPALFIEMKRPGGVISPEQEVFHELLSKQGYKCVVCRSTLEAIQEITNYLKRSDCL